VLRREESRGRGRRTSERKKKPSRNPPSKKSKKMFYALTLEKELELQPRFFGPRMREVLQQKLISEVRLSGSRGGRRENDERERVEERKRKHLMLQTLSRRQERRATLSPLSFSLPKK
jgi:hypothetical protein